MNVSDVRRMEVNTLGPDMFSSSDFAALDDLVAKLQTGQGADEEPHSRRLTLLTIGSQLATERWRAGLPKLILNAR